jgi:hypothetical protein
LSEIEEIITRNTDAEENRNLEAVKQPHISSAIYGQKMEHPNEIHSEELTRLYPESCNLLLLRGIFSY